LILKIRSTLDSLASALCFLFPEQVSQSQAYRKSRVDINLGVSCKGEFVKTGCDCLFWE